VAARGVRDWMCDQRHSDGRAGRGERRRRDAPWASHRQRHERTDDRHPSVAPGREPCGRRGRLARSVCVGCRRGRGDRRRPATGAAAARAGGRAHICRVDRLAVEAAGGATGAAPQGPLSGAVPGCVRHLLDDRCPAARRSAVRTRSGRVRVVRSFGHRRRGQRPRRGPGRRSWVDDGGDAARARGGDRRVAACRGRRGGLARFRSGGKARAVARPAGRRGNRARSRGHRRPDARSPRRQSGLPAGEWPHEWALHRAFLCGWRCRFGAGRDRVGRGWLDARLRGRPRLRHRGARPRLYPAPSRRPRSFRAKRIDGPRAVAAGFKQGDSVMKIFLAGATGAIGKRLVPLLLDAGHQVVGTTRTTTKADALRAVGVAPVVVDVFDAPTLARAVSAARPDIVVHQLTDLPPGLDPARMAEGTRRNARMRREGTRNLVAAALAAGVQRLVAQSIAWMYAPGPEPHGEDDPLDVHADGVRAITADGVATLERLAIASPPIEAVVLRYGHLYGPGTGADAGETPSLHVDAAASAALLAIEKARSGIYNLAEPNRYLSTDKARRELGFDPSFRLTAWVGLSIR